jgi:hypothetical protein
MNIGPQELEWGSIAAEAVADAPREDYKALLTDLCQRCNEQGITVPYSIPILIVLAETYQYIISKTDR